MKAFTLLPIVLFFWFVTEAVQCPFLSHNFFQASGIFSHRQKSLLALRSEDIPSSGVELHTPLKQVYLVNSSKFMETGKVMPIAYTLTFLWTPNWHMPHTSVRPSLNSKRNHLSCPTLRHMYPSSLVWRFLGIASNLFHVKNSNISNVYSILLFIRAVFSLYLLLLSCL